jgi:hypothetical protein
MRRAKLVPFSFAITGAVVLATLYFVRASPPLLDTQAAPTQSERIPRRDLPGSVSQADSFEDAPNSDASSSVVKPVGVNLSLPACGPGDEEGVGECLGQFLSMQFNSERRDDSWADATERTIVDGLTQASTVTRVASLTVECRETVCRLQMAFPTVHDVPTKGPRERDVALVSTVFRPLLASASLRPLIVPHPRSVDYPERIYYFAR